MTCTLVNNIKPIISSLPVNNPSSFLRQQKIFCNRKMKVLPDQFPFFEECLTYRFSHRILKSLSTFIDFCYTFCDGVASNFVLAKFYVCQTCKTGLELKANTELEGSWHLRGKLAFHNSLDIRTVLTGLFLFPSCQSVEWLLREWVKGLGPSKCSLC